MYCPDQALACLLVEVTEQVLWQEIQPWLRERDHCIQLRCRVGSGRATYHSQQGARHTITYGRKMITSKRCPQQAQLWTTAREIQSRGYFGGQAGFAELMAHTCCHEFAHLVQSLNGWYRRGSIHNRGFYQILDRIHRSGTAGRVLEALRIEAARHSVSLTFDTPSGAPSDSPRIAIQRGQRVGFRYRGRQVSGIITRINQKTVRIEQHGIDGVEYFRVPPSQLDVEDQHG
ncbi:hypothetical protein MIB92_00310 [Aestuariirhabdus sp. Z084]|uniref:hypothetical protein n=1 Tax=Aestuariirhabdus haliotis TaxID=2918751 RepID=UPI00201B3A3F|nr:hypothetical protein [Aestuariirhabdus haliotis]MCL6414078.1 hypothetical protein [Aestuariirhabdus haliotis]MCL6418010.1 hypothetical protein [Aestuariirhabdus haliotis]